MSNILKVNKGGKIKQYSTASQKRTNLLDNNSVTRDMLNDNIVNYDKLDEITKAKIDLIATLESRITVLEGYH